MTTSQLSLAIEDNSTSLQGGSHVKISALPGVNRGLKRALDRVCSSRLSDSFASVDLATSCWKTSQLSLLPTEGGIWEQYSGSFPKSGTMRSGKLYRQTPWGPPTSEKDSGLWPTPTASDMRSRNGKNVGKYKNGGFYLQTTKGRSCVRVTNVMNFLDRPDLATSPAFREQMMGYPEGWTLVRG